MKWIIFINILIAIGTANSNKLYAQMIVPLYKTPDAHTDTGKGQGLIIPSLNLRIDRRNQLFHGDTLLFKPQGEFEFCIYEVINNKYLLISAISKAQSSSSAIYILPKHKVKLYPIAGYQKAWSYDFCAKKLIDIDAEQIILKNKEGTIEYLKLPL